MTTNEATNTTLELTAAARAVSISSPYFRAFVAGALWFSVIAVKMVWRHPGHWSTYPPRNWVVLVVAWVITALLLAIAATHFQKMRSWWCVGLGTVAGSFLVLWLMLFYG